MSKYGYKIAPHTFFVFAAVPLWIVFNILTPPLQAPDEFNHFYRAYQVAEGNFLPVKKDQRLGGMIPYSVDDFFAPYKFTSTVFGFRPGAYEVINSFHIPIEGEDIPGGKEFRDFPNSASYSPVSYIPQALSIFVLKRFDCSLGALYYGGRCAVFVTWLLAMFFVIKSLPVCKWLFTLLILLPMQLYVTNSFSADTVTNILAFVFIATVFKLAFATENFKARDLWILLLLAVLLAFAKLVYIGLLFLLLMIPAHKFKTPAQRWVVLSVVLLVSLLCALTWSAVVSGYYVSYKDYNPAYVEQVTLRKGADYYGQQKHILNNPAYFPEVVYKSIFNPGQTYLDSYIGCFGAFKDWPLPWWVSVTAYFVILLIAITEKNEMAFSWRHKSIILLSALASLVLLLLSLHITWDPVGSGIVDQIQGRYLIPVFPLLFMLFTNRQKQIRFSAAFLVIPFVIFINVCAAQVLYNRYVYDPFDEKVQFTCNAEKVDEAGNFVTSDLKIVLQGCNNRSSDYHRHGNYSALVSPRCPFSFTKVFKGLSQNDVVDVVAWRKGEGMIVLSGGRKNCGEFYHGFGGVGYRDRQGWELIHAHLKISVPCDTIGVGFFATSADNKSVYFDDLHFTIKRSSLSQR